MEIEYPVVFDTDCISSFLWVEKVDIINQVFHGSKIIPKKVYDEIQKLKKFSNYRFVFDELDNQISLGNFIVDDFLVTSNKGKEYLSLISLSNPMRIGDGEAAALSIVKTDGGTIASNNLKDIIQHVSKNKIPHIHTDTILYLYYKNNIDDPSIADKCNNIWNAMKNKKRNLPAYDFYKVINKFERLNIC